MFFGIRVLPELYLTTTMLTAAYLILFLPVCIRGRCAVRVRCDRTRAGGLGAHARRRLPGDHRPGVAAHGDAGAGGRGGAGVCRWPRNCQPPSCWRPSAPAPWPPTCGSLNNDLRYGQAAGTRLALIVVTSIPTVPLSTRFLPRGMMSALRLTGVTVGYGGATVVRDVSFEVPPLSITAVIGPSGCGKTTLLRAIAGLEPVRSGTIEITAAGERKVLAGLGVHVPAQRRRGLVPQDGVVRAPEVAENIGFGLRHNVFRKVGDTARAAGLLELTGLTELADRKPALLSGGQRQRVVFGPGAGARPTIICLDEPFSALDAHLRTTLRSQVRQMILADGAAALLVTHDPEERWPSPTRSSSSSTVRCGRWAPARGIRRARGYGGGATVRHPSACYPPPPKVMWRAAYSAWCRCAAPRPATVYC